ncbi:MAG: alpha/beta hydrolase, partial [Microbacterium sp.]|nr:alpha/beta hydrolase [Microbacterium sp.]
MASAGYERLPAVPYDPQLLAGMEMMRQLFEPVPLRADTIVSSREHVDRLTVPGDVAQLAGDAPVRIHEVSIPGTDAGDPEIVLTIISPQGGAQNGPGLYAIHGGGMVLGNRFMAVVQAIPLVVEFGAVAVSVEYRLAPENRWPAGVEDCYAGLAWFAAHAEELG